MDLLCDLIQFMRFPARPIVFHLHSDGAGLVSAALRRDMQDLV